MRLSHLLEVLVVEEGQREVERRFAVVLAHTLAERLVVLRGRRRHDDQQRLGPLQEVTIVTTLVLLRVVVIWRQSDNN